MGLTLAEAAQEPRSTGRYDSRRRQFWTTSAIFTVLVIFFLIWMAARIGGPHLTNKFDDIGELIGALVGGIACLVAARRKSGRERASWRWIAAGALCWAVGESIWSWYDVVRGVTVPFPSFADFGFLAEVPLVLIGVLLLPASPAGALPRTRIVLDGVLLAVSLLVASWATVLGAAYRAGGPNVFAEVVSLAYPIADVITVAVALSVLTRAGRSYRFTVSLLIAGMLALAISDSAFVYLTQTTTYSSGDIVNTGWVAGFLLLGLAALWPTTEARHNLEEGEGPLVFSTWQIALPYVLLTGAAAFIATKYAVDRRLDIFLIVTGLVLIAVVLIRQVVTLIENTRLTRLLSHQARHDPLTGLGNREFFTNRIGIELRPRRQEDQRVAVLLCDLDGFKDVNDTLGHAAGDAVLAAVADRLRDSVRPGDAVVRLGGDEFAVVLGSGVTNEQASTVAIRIIDAMRASVVLSSKEWTPQISIGIAIKAADETTGDELLKEADVALYAAKAAGGDTYRLFDPELGAIYFNHLALQGDLASALTDGQLFLAYEPIFRLDGGDLEGIGVHLRWQHPTRGVLAAEVFATMAERSGVIVEIGQWMHDEALRHLCQWHDRFPSARDIWMAVNVSRRELVSADLVTRFAHVLASTGLEPSSLCIQLTTNVFRDEGDLAADMAESLKLLGVRLAIGDLGTDYALLDKLTRRRLDMMTLDETFVDALGSKGDWEKVVESVIKLAHACEMRVVGTGIVTEAEVAQLARLGCDLGQGLFWTHPQKADGFEQWLDHWFTPVAGRRSVAAEESD